MTVGQTRRSCSLVRHDRGEFKSFYWLDLIGVLRQVHETTGTGRPLLVRSLLTASRIGAGALGIRDGLLDPLLHAHHPGHVREHLPGPHLDSVSSLIVYKLSNLQLLHIEHKEDLQPLTSLV